jgi:hypothetical protein
MTTSRFKNPTLEPKTGHHGVFRKLQTGERNNEMHRLPHLLANDLSLETYTPDGRKPGGLATSVHGRIILTGFNLQSLTNGVSDLPV